MEFHSNGGQIIIRKILNQLAASFGIKEIVQVSEVIVKLPHKVLI